MEERNETFLSGGLAEPILKKGSAVDEKELGAAAELKVSSENLNAELLPVSEEELPRASVGDLTKATPSARSKDKSDETFEPLTRLPRAGIGLLYALLMTLCMGAFALFASDGMPKAFWFAVPLQVYFAYCIGRLSDVIGMKRGTPSPLSPLAVATISLVSLMCFPVFAEQYHYPNRFLDPFWLLFMTAQCVWPLVLSHAIERTFSLRTVITTCVAAIPFFLMSLLPLMFNVPLFFLPVWLFSQFACVVYLSSRLQQVFLDDMNIIKAKLAALRAQVSGVSKDDIVVRYRPFAAIERWIKQRFTGGDLVKGTQLLLLWTSVPVVVLLLLFGLTALDSALYQSVNDTHIGKAAAQAAANLNGTFLRTFLPFVFLLFVAPLALYLKTPTHLLFNRHGLRFLWRHGKFSSNGSELSWRNLDSIDLERPKGSTQPLDQFLCFKSKAGQVQKLKLSAVDSIQDREKILAMIRNWAPNVPRPPEVDQCLEPPPNHSYTEMWLQALSAPPKRERLKPLLDGASLQAGKYRVLNQLGVGGQGSAYLANDNIDDEVVVLKEFILPVHVDVNVRKSALESFENEARILKQIDSTGVVRLIDFFVEDHRAYLVLEHIDGMSLRELVEKNGAMKESQVKELAVQMCGILSYLHSLSPPVVHRDFTPDNLILQRDGTLKLIDFNVAQQVEATVTGTVVGKHAYLPPEQFRGMPTSQSDIYACGATLHFLLTGSDPEPISQSHPGKQVANLSNGMDHIVAHATQLDCGQRYDTVESMARDVGELT
ncbi:MAG: serine/threonine protein kinase [Candidatus Melainabacteria bacterium]|nr:serine/threonine protein kinase [Candidatus Melainabacteria bacterium]